MLPHHYQYNTQATYIRYCCMSTAATPAPRWTMLVQVSGQLGESRLDTLLARLVKQPHPERQSSAMVRAAPAALAKLIRQRSVQIQRAGQRLKPKTGGAQVFPGDAVLVNWRDAWRLRLIPVDDALADLHDASAEQCSYARALQQAGPASAASVHASLQVAAPQGARPAHTPNWASQPGFVLQNDEHVLVVDKPAGVHSIAPGRDSTHACLPQAWAALASARGAQSMPKPLHRLDAPVTGCHAAAWSVAAASAFSKCLAAESAPAAASAAPLDNTAPSRIIQPLPDTDKSARLDAVFQLLGAARECPADPQAVAALHSQQDTSWLKVYLARVPTWPADAPDAGVITAPLVDVLYTATSKAGSVPGTMARLARWAEEPSTKGAWVHACKLNAIPGSAKQALLADGGKLLRMWQRSMHSGCPATPAVSQYRVLRRGASGQPVELALSPWTGRKHQLRQHVLLASGQPIIGDVRYGHRPWSSSARPAAQIDLHAAGMYARAQLWQRGPWHTINAWAPPPWLRQQQQQANR